MFGCPQNGCDWSDSNRTVTGHFLEALGDLRENFRGLQALALQLFAMCHAPSRQRASGHAANALSFFAAANSPIKAGAAGSFGSSAARRSSNDFIASRVCASVGGKMIVGTGAAASTATTVVVSESASRASSWASALRRFAAASAVNSSSSLRFTPMPAAHRRPTRRRRTCSTCFQRSSSASISSKRVAVFLLPISRFGHESFPGVNFENVQVLCQSGRRDNRARLRTRIHRLEICGELQHQARANHSGGSRRMAGEKPAP